MPGIIFVYHSLSESPFKDLRGVYFQNTLLKIKILNTYSVDFWLSFDRQSVLINLLRNWILEVLAISVWNLCAEKIQIALHSNAEGSINVHYALSLF